MEEYLDMETPVSLNQYFFVLRETCKQGVVYNERLVVGLIMRAKAIAESGNQDELKKYMSKSLIALRKVIEQENANRRTAKVSSRT